MVERVCHGGRDAWVGSAHPSGNHGDAPYLRLSQGGQYGLLRMAFAHAPGPTVTSATLELHARGSMPAQTLTVTRLADGFVEDQVTWNSMPGVTGTGASVTVGALNDGDLISIDVTSHVQTIFSGAKNYGWRIESDNTAASRVYGLDAGQYQPRLVIELANKPGTPTDLVPGDGSVVSDAAPTVMFSYVDVTGEGMGALQVQCDPAGNATAPAFDSGAITASDPELDLSTTTFTALTAGGSTQWRARAKGNDGAWSDWSDWAQFTYQPQLVIMPSSPSTGTPFVYEPTPPITWTTDKAMSQFRVRIARQDDHTHILYDSHHVKASGTAGSITIPKKWRGNRVLREDKAYALNIRAWDTETAREATPKHPTFGQVWLDFTADTDAAVAAPDTLTAQQDGITPWVILTWTRSSAPDSFVVRMDGKVVESGILPQDVLVSGSQYQWRFKGAAPRQAHTFHVRAVVNDHASPNSPDATLTTYPVGIWIIDPDTTNAACIFGNDPGSLAQPDLAGIYTTLAGLPRRVVTGKQGLQGQMVGVLVDALGQSAETNEANLYTFAETPDKEYQLILADVSIPVWLGDVNSYPTPDTHGDDVVKGVSFSFGQTGDFPFDMRL